jgi:hypothetical protein
MEMDEHAGRSRNPSRIRICKHLPTWHEAGISPRDMPVFTVTNMCLSET